VCVCDLGLNSIFANENKWGFYVYTFYTISNYIIP
jgi:hypothetical protein